MFTMNGLAKNIFQKDITYYSKYQEFSGIFKMNDHISDNSIQISIKFTFTVYEFINVDEYILLSFFDMHTGSTGSFLLLETAYLIVNLI